MGKIYLRFLTSLNNFLLFDDIPNFESAQFFQSNNDTIESRISYVEFTRIKIGVGRPQGQDGDIDHVLGVPSQEEYASISGSVRAATEAIETILTEGIETAMNKFN